MNVRPATHADAPLLAHLNQYVHAIHVAAHPQVYKPLDPDDPALIAFFADVLAEATMYTFVAESAGVAAGFIVARAHRRPEHVFLYARDALYIDQIAVDPAYRGQGCGRALVEAVFTLADQLGIADVTLDVADFNHEAQAFFARMGFATWMHRMQTTRPGPTERDA